MLYLISVLDDGTNTDAPEVREAIDLFNEGMQPRGDWVFAGGLGVPDTATVIDARGGAAIFTDGPFVESKEYLAGFWIIEAPDLDAALALATAGSKACNRRVEVRPFLVRE
jgi:hypothetical protein